VIVPVISVDRDMDRRVSSYDLNRRRGVESAEDRAITRANVDFVTDKALTEVSFE
jgi:hypothetical protein